MNGKSHFVDLSLDGNTIFLKLILKKQLYRIQCGEI